MKTLAQFVFAVILMNTPITLLAGKYNAILNIGDSMPEFKQLPTTDNAHISSSDIKASVVVLISLANHCPWVRGMDKDLIKLVDSFKNQDVRFIGFSVNHMEDDRLPAMKEHAKKAGYNFTYMFDESQEIGRQLGATRTPEYFIFDKNRKLAYMGLLYNSPAKMNWDGSIKHINGQPTQFYVQQAINAILNKQTVNPEETRAHGCSVKYN